MATTQVKVPDIGDFSDVPIIELHVNKGDTLAVDDPVITLESDKAMMDVPAPEAGQVEEVLVKVGDEVSEGTPILTLSTDQVDTPPSQLLEQQEPATETAPAPTETAQEPAASATDAPVQPPGAPAQAEAPVQGGQAPATQTDFSGVHAGPSVRRAARELGVDLTAIEGTGPKGRIEKDDVLAFLRGPGAPATDGAAPAGTGIPEIPAQDFSKFGPVETKALERIKKISGPFVHRSWLNVPHVTHNDDADITELDAYRKELDAAAKAEGYRVTLLAFLMKASVSVLKQFEDFNSSLAPDKENLIVKDYYHIGIAVDTPAGLVVPVIRDVDRKGITELSKELGDISAKARDGKLTPGEMQGGTFTISSLGGIGGTAFTPIINAPEVAILGVVRSRMTPVWNGEEFKPRLMLPLSLSYDHRVIDGAAAARFVRQLSHVLEDVRRLVL